MIKQVFSENMLVKKMEYMSGNGLKRSNTGSVMRYSQMDHIIQDIMKKDLSMAMVY